MDVVVIGTGAIGGAAARRLLAAGRRVTVWNRAGSRVAGLVADGAVAAGSVAAAVRAAELVLVAVKDHPGVRECLAAAGTALAGRTVVVLCTGGPADARQTAALVEALGGRCLDAGVQTGPELAGATFLYGGSRDAFRQHRETLELLGRAHFAGDAPEAAAVWDLALFGVWYDAQLGLLRALDTVRAAGIDPAAFGETAAVQIGHVADGVPATVAELARADYPAGPAGLAEHLPVLRELIALRAGRPLGDGGLAAAAARVEALIDAGHVDRGLTATIGVQPAHSDAWHPRTE
jgi:3-hydroxyisobutyrate dehydrogenase-like beta-hydroxyacid dehydrogenase